MKQVKKIVQIVLLLFLSSNSFAQMNFFGEWQSIGPNEKPGNPQNESASGIGPVEFIRIHPLKPNHLLAGSLSGGLFYTVDGGQNWKNSGSDHWTYSGTSWADFHPEQEKVWFAVSNYAGMNGNPGSIEKEGGIMRTLNGGKSWQNIGSYKEFTGSRYTRIFGFRFLPGNANVMFVLTNQGLFFTSNCLGLRVNWERISAINGLVYDMDFTETGVYITEQKNDKWALLQLNLKANQVIRSVLPNTINNKPMRNLTIEPVGDKILMAKDYVSGSDEMVQYDPVKDTITPFLKSQRINFGSGHTFAINPNQKSLLFGMSISIKKYSYPSGRKMDLGKGYHVDIECAAYHPTDTSIVYLASHGGVYYSNNGGASWQSRSKGLGIAEVMGLAVSTEDPNQIAIGCFHDGSMVRADFDQNGTYEWLTVNGGDGLTPLIQPGQQNIVYTSNQYVGGGLYYSTDTAKGESIHIHKLQGVKTAGWETAAVLHPHNPEMLFFNFTEKTSHNNGNINIARTSTPYKKNSMSRISDFKVSNGLDKYKVYGLFNSNTHPEVLIAYVLHYAKDDQGRPVTFHRLFRTDHALDSADKVIESWYEIEHPNNRWIADVEMDGKEDNVVYVSYNTGNENPQTIFGDLGVVYRLEYKSNLTHELKKEIDISRGLSNTLAGRFNMAYHHNNSGGMFIATREGVFYASSRVLKGKSYWKKVGKNLPHCKVYGLDLNEKKNILTLGVYGRGVWQYKL